MSSEALISKVFLFFLVDVELSPATVSLIFTKVVFLELLMQKLKIYSLLEIKYTQKKYKND